MLGSRVSPALKQFIEDELLRAPLLFDQIAEGSVDQMRKALPGMTSFERNTVGEVMTALQAHRTRLSDRFLQSLREQVGSEMAATPTPAAMPKLSSKPVVLALVEEDAVALDVELSHTIQLIKNAAEHELRELRLFIAALVGDMDVADDHNPFRPETFARATWAAAQALPLSRGHQVSFVRYAGEALAGVLRMSYAASCSRLEQMGVEPASYRTVILPGGSRRSHGASMDTTFSPDLQRMRETMPAPLDTMQAMSYQGQQPVAARKEHWVDIARGVGNRVDRQSIELVSRLFDAIAADERVPPDVSLLISRLHGPAMRLTLRDEKVLDRDVHPLWHFVHVLAYEAEMAPDPHDPERVRLLKLAQQTIDQIAGDSNQRTSIYQRAVERLEEFLKQRLARRCAAAATQIGAMQKLEDSLISGEGNPSTLGGMLDVPVMDTVPADMVGDSSQSPHDVSVEWLTGLRPGHWVRMFIQGRWVQAQLMWPGEKGEVWLFGDGGSDATWAVRRGALLMMHAGNLAKSLRMRSLVGSAAVRVQDEVEADKV